MSKVVVKEMTSSKLADRNKALNTDLVFAKASAITGISKVHNMHVVHGNVVPHILTKDGISGNLDDGVHCNKSPRDPGNDKSIEVGDWYILDYEGRRFPGEVVVVGDGEFQVSVMERAGKYWKWPSPKDVIFYMREKMISRLDFPEIANNRGHFKFSTEI